MLNVRVDSFYKYANNLFFNVGMLELTKLYLPILSSDALKLFMHMYSDILSYDIFRLTKRNISSLLDSLNLTIEQFDESRTILESLGLLKTYISNTSDVIFNLIPPLNYNDFMSNNQMKTILSNKIGDDGMCNLEMIFANNEIPSFYNEITTDISTYFEKEIYGVPKFDFDKLYANLSLTTSIGVTITDDVKELIEYYYSKKIFTFEQIEGYIYNSIIKKDNNFIISYNLLSNLFNDNDKEIIKNYISKTLKIQRINDLFIENCSISLLNKAYKDYSSFSTEQYLNQITGSLISESEINIINTLRKQYGLNDKLINLMIDYSIDKTHHQLNEKYLSKIARSFSIVGINSLDDAYNFLVKWNNQSISKKTCKKISKKCENKFDVESNENNDHIIINSNDSLDTTIGDFNIDLLG